MTAHRLSLSMAACLCTAIGTAQAVDVVPLESLTMDQGVRIEGAAPSSGAGATVASIGDVNDDGIDDLLIGAPLEEAAAGEHERGAGYVVFGSRSRDGVSLSLASLDGVRGTKLFASSGPWSALGYAATGLGDINGDGIDDFAVSDAWYGAPMRGAIAIVFGRKQWPASIDLQTLDSASGVVGIGPDGDSREIGGTLASGDYNADGIGDLAYGTQASMAYIEFGRGEPYEGRYGMHWNVGLRTPDPTANGGGAGDDWVGVAHAGDVNGDGIDDFVVLAPTDDPGPRDAFVVFGRVDWPAGVVDLLDLPAGSHWRITAASRDASALSAAAAGDIDGDGIGDLLLGARDGGGAGRASVGAVTVVYGCRGPGQPLAAMEDVDGSHAFAIVGDSERSDLGQGVASAGDHDGDGRSELLLAAPRATSTLGQWNAGKVYRLTPSASPMPAFVDVESSLLGDIVRYEGPLQGEEIGTTLATGLDFNADGRPDLVLGRSWWRVANERNDHRGLVHVIYGTGARTAARIFADGFNPMPAGRSCPNGD